MVLARSSPKESLEEHVQRALKAFELIERIHLRKIEKLFGLSKEDARDLMRRIIVFHDLGKAHKAIQDMLRNPKRSAAPLRHEALSAILAYFSDAFDEFGLEVKKAAVRAILLHHQPKVIGRIRCDNFENKLTRNFLLLSAGLPNPASEERKKYWEDYLEDPGFIEGRNEVIKRLKDINPEEFYQAIDELLNYGRNPKEKARVAALLTALIESDWLASQAVSGGQSEFMRVFHSVTVKAAEELKRRTPSGSIGVSIRPSSLLYPSYSGFVELLTPGITPDYDSLFLLGLLSVLDYPEGYVEPHARGYRILISKEARERITSNPRRLWERMRILLIASANYAYDTFKPSNLSALKNPNFPLYDNPKEGKKDPIISQHITPLFTGSYSKGAFKWGNVAKVKERVKERVKVVIKPWLEVFEKKYEKALIAMLGSLPVIGFALYTPKLKIGNTLFVGYPLLAPKRLPIAALKFTQALSLDLGDYYLDVDGYISFPGILFYFVLAIAPSLDLDVIDFFMAKFSLPKKPSEQPQIRGATYASAMPLWDFLLEFFRSLSKEAVISFERDHGIRPNVSNVCRMFSDLIRNAPEAMNAIAEAINDKSSEKLYEGFRILAAYANNEEKVANVIERHRRFFDMFSSKVIERVSGGFS